MENGFSSPRSEVFPAGLRVLVVDDDPTWLKILEKMLKKCSYEVTTCGLAIEALRFLRERKDGFDIVVSDVNMPDMDGFKLLELVGLEMDLPVIMMSVDGETSRVMKGVQHGACDYLLKPIRMKELRNIWQHVFRKKIHEIRDIESHDCIEGMFMRNSSDHSDDGIMLSVEELSCVRKRKDMDNKHDDKDYSDASSSKKARVVWSVDLHQKFVKAVNQIGFHKVGPKKILDLMSVPWLTRENVASHLQKYRLYLSRLQKEKENDAKSSFTGSKHLDAPLKEHSTNIHRNDISDGDFQFAGDNLLPQRADQSSLEDDLKGIASEPVTEKPKSTQTSFNRCFKPLESNVTFEPFSSSIPAKYAWNEALDHKPLLHSENSFNKIPLPDPTSISSISSKRSTAEIEPSVSIKRTKPLYPEYNHNDSRPVAAKCHMAANQTLEPIYTTTSSVAVQASNLVCAGGILEVSQRGLIFGDDLQAFLQGDYNGDLLGVRGAGYMDYGDPWLANDVPLHLDDSPRFGFEYPYDPVEFAIVDQSLLT